MLLIERQFPFVLVALVAFTVALVAVWALLPVLRRFVVDQPQAWKSHRVPTPRGGGLGIAIGMAAGFGTAAVLDLPLARADVLLATLAMCVVGIIDDFVGHLRVGIRLACQVGAAGWVAVAVQGLDRMPLPPPLDFKIGIFAIPVAMIWIVGVANIYNFMDGIDGLAASQGVVAGGALAVLVWDHSMRVTGMALAGACAAFLIFNWQPARVFMGDVGSASVGFLLACMPFHPHDHVREEAMVVAAFSLWLFLTDGTYTLVKRILRREKFWHPHREHLYQRLVRAGWPHWKVTVGVSCVNGAFALVAIWASRRVVWSLVWWWLFLAGALVFAGYVMLVRRVESWAQAG